MLWFCFKNFKTSKIGVSFMNTVIYHDFRDQSLSLLVGVWRMSKNQYWFLLILCQTSVRNYPAQKLELLIPQNRWIGDQGGIWNIKGKPIFLTKTYLKKLSPTQLQKSKMRPIGSFLFSVLKEVSKIKLPMCFLKLISKTFLLDTALKEGKSSVLYNII